jgi:hypothetical protein
MKYTHSRTLVNTGSGSLYAHLRNEHELYQLMLEQLIGEVTVPEP